MDVIPAIDVEAGRSRVVYWPGASAGVGAPTDRPDRIAEQFVAQGARILHLVDFDGAQRAAPANLEAVGAVAARVAVPLQLAGGLEEPDHVRLAFAAGATRVVLSIAIVERPDALAGCLAVAGDWLAVGLDPRPDRLAALPLAARPRTPTLDAPRRGARRPRRPPPGPDPRRRRARRRPHRRPRPPPRRRRRRRGRHHRPGRRPPPARRRRDRRDPRRGAAVRCHRLPTCPGGRRMNPPSPASPSPRSPLASSRRAARRGLHAGGAARPPIREPASGAGPARGRRRLPAGCPTASPRRWARTRRATVTLETAKGTS